MSPNAARTRALLALVLFTTGACVHAAEKIRLAGSNTIGARLAPALVEAWAKKRGLSVAIVEEAPEERTLILGDGDAAIEVQIRSHGTSTGYAALARGETDLWMASRAVAAKEIDGAKALGPLASPAQEHVIALDGLAIVVHPSNPLRAVSVEQVRGIFTGSISDWSQLGAGSGPITLHARDDQSGTFDTFKSLVLGSASLSPRARRYESGERLAEAVLADPRSVGFVGFASVGEARALAIGGAGVRPLEPNVFTVATEDYALARRLYLYHAERLSPLARSLVDFASSDEGQAVVERLGFVAQTIQSFRIAAPDVASGEYATLTRDAQRLSVNFRFSSGESYLDGKALRDLDRLAAFLRGREAELMLFGFVDGHETHPVQALALSADRADHIAAELVARGVPASRVRGVGGAAPVTSDESELGRSRNRRVEAWIRAKPDALATQRPSSGNLRVASGR